MIVIIVGGNIEQENICVLFQRKIEIFGKSFDDLINLNKYKG